MKRNGTGREKEGKTENQFVVEADRAAETEILRLEMSIVINRQFIILSPLEVDRGSHARQHKSKAKRFRTIIEISDP